MISTNKYAYTQADVLAPNTYGIVIPITVTYTGTIAIDAYVDTSSSIIDTSLEMYIDSACTRNLSAVCFTEADDDGIWLSDVNTEGYETYNLIPRTYYLRIFTESASTRPQFSINGGFTVMYVSSENRAIAQDDQVYMGGKEHLYLKLRPGTYYIVVERSRISKTSNGLYTIKWIE